MWNPFSSFFKNDNTENGNAELEELIKSAVESKLEKIKTLPANQKAAALWDSLTQVTTGSTPHVLDQQFGKGLHHIRQLLNQSFADKIIIHRRQQQVRGMSKCVSSHRKELGWRVVHKRHDEEGFKVSKEVEKRCKKLEDFLMHGASKRIHSGGLRDVLSILTYDQLAFDRKCLVIEKHSKYQDKPGGFYCVDPVTIKPTVSVLYDYMGTNVYSGMSLDDRKHHFKEAIKSLNNALKGTGDHRELQDVNWVQVIDERVSQGFDDSEIAVGIVNPNEQINGFGYSKESNFTVSYALTEVLTHALGLNREMFNKKIPSKLVGVKANSVSQKWLKDFNSRITEQGAMSYAGFALMPLDDPEKDMKAMDIADNPREMQFRELVTLFLRIVLAAYGMDTSELNLPHEGGGGAQSNRTKEIDEQKQTGLISLLGDLANFITRHLIEPWDDELEFRFITSLEDEHAGDEHLEKEAKTWRTVDETRKVKNLSPIGGELGSIILNPQFVQVWLKLKELELQAKQQAEQQKKASEEGKEGESNSSEDDDIKAKEESVAKLEQQLADLEKAFSNGESIIEYV